MSQANLHRESQFSLPTPIAQKMRRVQRRMTGVGVFTAAVASIAVLLSAMLLAMLVDYLATLYDSSWRSVLTYSAFSLAIATLIGWVVFAWRRSRQMRHVARQVDRSVPYLEERWSTVAHFAEQADRDDGEVHPAMFRQVAQEAERGEAYVDPGEVVSLSGVVKAFLALNAVTLVLVLAAVADLQQTTVLLRRFWSPAANISATQFVDETGDTVVARGEPLLLTASLTGPAIDRVTLTMQSNGGATEHIALMPRPAKDRNDVATGDRAATDSLAVSHRLRSVEESFTYRLRGGDGQTDWRQVTVADRPSIEAVQIRITPPAYRHEPAKQYGRLPRKLSAVEGSTFSIAIRPAGPLKSLRLETGADEPVELVRDGDGWYRWQTELTRSLSLTPLLTEPQGLMLRRPPTTRLYVYPDRPPVVRILSPGDNVAVSPEDTIQVDFLAEDDNGIGAAELVVLQQPLAPGEEAVELATIPVDLGDDVGEQVVRASAELDLSKYPLVDGASLSYLVRVIEQRSPDPSGRSNETNEATLADASPTASAPEAQPADDSQADRVAETSPDGNVEAQVAATTEETSSAERDQQVASANSPNDSEDSPSSAAGTATGQTAAATDSNGESDEAAGENPQVASAADGMKSESAESVASASDSESAMPSPASPVADLAAEAKPSASPQQAPEDSSPRLALASDTPRDSASMDSEPTEGDSAIGEASTTIAENSAANESTDEAAQQDTRTAESEERSLVAASPSQEQPPSETTGDLAAQRPSTDQSQESGSESTQGTPVAGSQEAASDSGSQLATSEQPSPDDGSQDPASNQPGDEMTRRMLDTGAQASSSNPMRVEVDKYAGSFAGQQRAKLEIAIAPELNNMEKQLTRAQKLSRSVLDDLASDNSWLARHQRDVSSAETALKQAQMIARDLQGRTHRTPYAFIGLQIADISAANVTPARDYLWKSLQEKGDERVARIRQGWQQIEQALNRIAELSQRFESTRREYNLADAAERVNTMYRIFIEDTFAMPRDGGDGGSKFERKMAQFDLDEEYLERLQEVLEMQRDLRAELAKILAEDPRLLRRFMNNFREGQLNLRNQLTDLAERQNNLKTESEYWANVTSGEIDKSAALTVVARRRLAMAGDIAADIGRMAGRFVAWMPLESEVTKELQAGLDEANAIAADAEELAVVAQRLASQKVGPDAFAPVVSQSKALYDRLRAFEVVLRRLGAATSGEVDVEFVVNRLADTRSLITLVSSWNRRMQEFSSGNFHRVAAVEQYALATDADALAAKLGDLETRLAGLLQSGDGTLPSSLAMQSRALLQTLDQEVTPNQMGAAIALERERWPSVAKRQQAAVDALATAEQQFDDLMKAAIAELDKLPVQDPIAQALDDPTLDEILAELERETRLAEALGIPPRPSNLQIINDWLRPDQNGRGGAGMVARQMQRLQERMRRAARRAQLEAMKRIRQSQGVVVKAVQKPTGDKRAASWNVLVSQLEDDLLQGRDKLPPERYRTAIEQYRTIMNRVASESGAEP